MATIVDILETRLNLTGLGAYTSGMGKAGLATSRFGLVLGGVAVAGFALFARAARAAADESEQFTRASGNFKGAFPIAEIEAFATGLENMSRFSDGAIADALGLAGAMGLTAAAAKELAQASANAAEATRAKGTTLGSALEAGGRAVAGGQVRGLRQLGIFLDQTAFQAATTEERLRLVVKAMNDLGGSDAAKRGTQTLSGSLDQLNNALSNVQESFGKAGGGPLVSLIQSATTLVNKFNELPQIVKQGIGIGIPAAATLGFFALQAIQLKARLLEIQFYKTAAAGAAAVNPGMKFGGIGKGLGAAAGLGLAAAGVSMVPTGGNALGEAFKLNGERALGGAAVGAAIGSIIPGLGTALGGIIGAALGVGGGMVGDALNPQTALAKGADPTLDELKKQTALLEKGFADKGAVDFNRLSIVQQRAIQAWGSSVGSVA